MIEPARYFALAEEMAGRADEDPGYAALTILSAHAALEAAVNRLGRAVIPSFKQRARFLPKWHDLCERALGRQLEAGPDLERLHAMRDRLVGFPDDPARLDRRSTTPPPEIPDGDPSPEAGRWAVGAARRVIAEFLEASGEEFPGISP